jgi:hypothetical protein
MTDAALSPKERGEQFFKSLDKAQIGAAAMKLFYASVGEIVTIFSRSPAHKHYALADIEWMLLPAIAAGQFYVVEAAHKEHGLRSMIVAMTDISKTNVGGWVQRFANFTASRIISSSRFVLSSFPSLVGSRPNMVAVAVNRSAL